MSKMTLRGLFSHSLLIAWKDLLELFRNRMMLIMLIVMPLLMMTLAGYMFPSSTSLSNVSVALVNEDREINGYRASVAFIEALQVMSEETGMITLSNASSLDNVRNLIQEEEVDGGLIIHSNFTSNLLTGKQGVITVVTDQSNPQMSLLLENALKEVLEQMGTLAAQQYIKYALNITEGHALAVIKPYNVQTEGAVTGEFSYFDFIAPGLMAMTVMMSVMTGLPAAISHEREVGTLDGMMVAPVSRLAVILGKTLAQTARGMFQGTIILTLAVALFGVTIHGNIILIFTLLLLGVFSFVGLGVVITSFSKDQETAMMVMMALMFPMMLLSGVFFPIQQMPWFMQSISKVLPLTYATTALRKVMVLGAGIPAITTELAVLICFGVVMITLAVPIFKKAMTR